MGDGLLENGHFENNEMPTLQESEQGQGPSVCSGCGSYIFDQSYLLMAGKSWHSECLKCSVCSVPLNVANSCFMKDGNILCKEDYFRKHQSRACAGCGNWIGAEDLVMRARDLVYHVGCFLCTTCRRILVPGERFSIDDDTGRLHCWNCWAPSDCFDNLNNINPAFTGFYEEETRSKSRRKRKNNLPTDPVSRMPFGVDFCDGDQSGVFQPQKTKRMRTSFKHHQLRAMKNYFSINHNPDAKDLKQLAQETGLTKRVLQVWFQNARAKFRRGKTIKEIGKKGGSGKKDTSEDGAGSEGTSDETKNPQSGNDESIDDDVRPDSEREENHPPSSSVSEASSPSPEMSNFSSGDSRSDLTEASSIAVPWAFEGCNTGGSYHIPTLVLPDHVATSTSYPSAELEAAHRNILFQDCHNLPLSNEYYQMTCNGEKASPTGIYYPISQQ